MASAIVHGYYILPHMALDNAILAKLFRDPKMFESANDWRRAGFEVIRDSYEKIIVAKHEAAKGYLFKKYASRSSKDLYEKYNQRVEGSDLIRAHVRSRNLQHLVVPQKWLHELSSKFNYRGRPAYLLVVERFKILDKEDSLEEYRHIDQAVLHEVCSVLATFRGLDFTAKNAPFTKGGKIAFIDTEYAKRNEDSKDQRYPKYMEYARNVLSREGIHRAEALWNAVSG